MRAFFDGKLPYQYCTCAKEGQKCGSGKLGSSPGCCAGSQCSDGVSWDSSIVKICLLIFSFAADLPEAWRDYGTFAFGFSRINTRLIYSNRLIVVTPLSKSNSETQAHMKRGIFTRSTIRLTQMMSFARMSFIC